MLYANLLLNVLYHIEIEMKIRESCLQTGNFIYKPGISLTKQDFQLQRGSLGLQRGFSGYYLPDYYNAISECHVNGNSNVFIEFMLERIDDILDEVNEQIRKSINDESEYVKRLLEVMEFDVPYTAVSLMKQLGLKSRETFRKNYMDPALNIGAVERTIPDKPNSKNQRYIKR